MCIRDRGNIVGVATAITLGGAGALFWMWVSAVFGLATKYGESVLAVYYREKNAKGEMSGGPMLSIKNGCKIKGLGTVSYTHLDVYKRQVYTLA